MRNGATLYVLKNALMKIAYVVVIGFIPLPEYLIFDYFFPTVLVNSLVKNQLNRVNNIAVKSLQIIGR